MTSNAGVNQKAIQVGFGTNEAIKEASILDSLGSFFKPEFLNRFDSIIDFNALDQDHILSIVDLMIEELQATLAELQISFAITDDVKKKLAELGYHPAFGARPLRRIIQELLEDTIADYILEQPNAKQLTAVMKDGEIEIVSEVITMQ